MNPGALLPWVFGAAVAIGSLRLVFGRTAPIRRAILLAAQPVVAGLLYLTLVPPRIAATGTLTVATRGASRLAGLSGSPVVALPEAPSLPGVERLPDLATAVRRYHPLRLRVIGGGLTGRDVDAADGLGVAFDAPPQPRGIVRLVNPAPVAPGGVFTVSGQVTGVAHAALDLLDPAGRRVDTAIPDRDGSFTVSGTARTPGPASFTLRVRDGATIVEAATVPQWTRAVASVRLWLIAGAPGPEVKYLRRWASDAGLAVHAEIAAGGGLALGDSPLPVTAATLAKVDVAIFDARSWTALTPTARAAILGAVRDGMGLVVRLDGPLDKAARAALRPLGVTASGEETVPLALAVQQRSDDARLARRGPGTTDDGADGSGGAVPALARWPAAMPHDAVPLLHDARGTPIAWWRVAGTGRIALWPIADSYRLVLAGAGDLYGEVWSAALSTVSRGHGSPPLTLDRAARIGYRTILCGLTAGTAVTAPDGHRSTLLVDPPRDGCAAYWPRTAGWHRVTGHDDAPFFAAPAAALPNVQAAGDRDATLALAAASPASSFEPAATEGSSWPWFVAWLAASTALWWFERIGRQSSAGDAA